MASIRNNYTEASKNETYKELLSKLECPFNWELENISKSIKIDYTPHDEEELLPLLKLMRILMIIFMETKDDKSDSNLIFEKLKECNDIYRILKNKAHPEVSSKIVYSVLQATKCFVYLRLNMEKELDLVYQNFEHIDEMNNKEKSTLLGCKAICWSIYHRAGSEVAEQLIREAMKLNGNCDMWHFILAKNLRRQRRDYSSLFDRPDCEERESFLKAYNISKNPNYGIFVAQMYRESRQYKEALKIYNNIFASFDCLCSSVLLRLALGFISQKKWQKAKACLDKAEKTDAKNSMYLHYRGIYFLKREEYLEATHYFEKAIDDFNLAAEKQYVDCIIKTQKSIDVTKYLLNMLVKYKSLPDKQLQPLILNVAFSYWKREHDLKESCRYFLKAIEINPRAKCLMNFYNIDVHHIKERNLYVFLEKYIFPEVIKKCFDEVTIERIKAIREYRHLNDVAQINALESGITCINTKK
ncbi:uncharacterized protein LOC131669535 [Phymastichus coffea]|uniref:uncharacterized protein LOC131669535 n=1 Tax=Phymastichus coffea TaxID=108790 RepID=UPI00273CAA52|nr:uncharacterized protein LOC131669535 [Phymastichus coffea]